MGLTCSESAVRRSLNKIKDSEFPWMREVGKCIPQHAIRNLGRAYSNYFSALKKSREGVPTRHVNRPRFKRKGAYDAFRFDNGCEKRKHHAVRVKGKRFRVPRLGWVKMREQVRFSGRILSVTISRRADWWFASFNVETNFEPIIRPGNSIAGCDLGITTFATIADVEGCRAVVGPKPLIKGLAKLRRLDQSLCRKVLGSNNWRKAKTKLARFHARIGQKRTDAIHKLTTELTKRYNTVCIEDLNPSGIIRNRHVSRAVSDMAFGEFRRQITYKANLYGSAIIVADRWFPSSQRCSSCFAIHCNLRFAESPWTCPQCGTTHDRDENAAVNLRIAASSAATACGAEGSGVTGNGRAKPSAENQEGPMGQNGLEIAGYVPPAPHLSR